MINIKIINGKTIYDFENKIILEDFENKITNEEFEKIISNIKKEKKDLIENLDIKNNLLLHTNNLIGLNILKEKLLKQIDVIYIDPPYYFNKIKSKNSFKYNSNFDLGDWLIFMNNRLEIAKELLNEEGVIFISINDDGVYHLKLLCDQIFGLENHLTTLKWNKNNSQNDTEYFQENIEHILIYKKNKKVVLKEIENKKEKVIKLNDKYYIKKGQILKGGEDGFLNNSTTLGYSIYYNPKTKEIIPKKDYNQDLARTSNDYNLIYEKEDVELINKGFELIRPPLSKGRIKRWTWGFDKMLKYNEQLFFQKNKSNTYSIYSLKEVKKEDVLDGFYIEKKYKSPKNLITIQSSKGSSRINDLFKGKENFAYSKPVELMSYLIELLVEKKDIKILDFFAGSGTIGESVLLLNKKDNLNRIFYLIEQMDYAKSLTLERLNKVKQIENINSVINYIKI